MKLVKMNQNKVKCLFGYHNWGKWCYKPVQENLHFVHRLCLSCGDVDDPTFDNLIEIDAKRIIHRLNSQWDGKGKI